MPCQQRYEMYPDDHEDCGECGEEMWKHHRGESATYCPRDLKPEE